jgi:hypothetical protein
MQLDIIASICALLYFIFLFYNVSLLVFIIKRTVLVFFICILFYKNYFYKHYK